MSIWYNSSSLFATDLERCCVWPSSGEGPLPLLPPLVFFGPLPRPVFPSPFFLEAVILIGADAPGRHGMLWKLLSPQPTPRIWTRNGSWIVTCFQCWKPWCETSWPLTPEVEHPCLLMKWPWKGLLECILWVCALKLTLCDSRLPGKGQNENDMERIQRNLAMEPTSGLLMRQLSGTSSWYCFE